ncbi:MAG: CapA family protein [Candidatus Faecousia sp.]|nr:CapA family protein [Candidatus Faecousia sp.]
MPQQDDGMEKRRQKREAQRRQRQAQARRMRLTLLLAAVVLAGCGVMLFRLTKSADTQQPAPQVQTVPTTEETQETTPAQKSPITTIHIKAAGDLNVTDSVVNAGMAVNSYDFSPVFKDVAAILADADLTVMNFEGNVCGAPYGTQTTSAPAELLMALRGCGVDLLQMANSCAVNNGLNGLSATLRAIRAAGIEPVGAFASDAEFKESKGYTMTEVQGVKVGFVAFTKGLGGRGMPAGNENLVNLLYTDYTTLYNKIDKTRITSILKSMEEEKPDITIALLHWGSEYNDDISKTQTQLVSLLQKNGVDVILGTHPHTLQPIVFDKSAGTLVAYSLGDFFGDAERGATNYSVILDLEITKDANAGTTKVTDYTLYPIYTVRETECVGNSDRRVVRIEKTLQAYNGNFLDKVTDACKESMEYALTRIDERIVMPEKDKK